MNRRNFIKGVATGGLVSIAPTLAIASANKLLVTSDIDASDSKLLVTSDINEFVDYYTNSMDMNQAHKMTDDALNDFHYRNSIIHFSRTHFDIDLTSDVLNPILRQCTIGEFCYAPLTSDSQAVISKVFACCILHDAYVTKSNILVSAESTQTKKRITRMLDYACDTLELPSSDDENLWIFENSIIDFNEHKIDYYYEYNANWYEKYIVVDQADELLRQNKKRVVYHMNDKNKFSIRTTETYHPPEL